MKLFLKHLFLAAMLCLLTSDAGAQVRFFEIPDHYHRYDVSRFNSEADRFMALYFLSQCRIDDANLWLRRSLEHNPRSVDAHRVLAELYPWAQGESRRLYRLAKPTDDITLYREALKCDPYNADARRELTRIMKARESPDAEKSVKR